MENQKREEDYRRTVERAGYLVGHGSVECDTFKLTHSNCTGCQYELGCGKMVRLMFISLIPLGYHPTSFADHQAMMQRIKELSEMVMGAEHVEELQKIPVI